MEKIDISDTRYSHGAIALHWILAVLILLNFIFVWASEDLPKPEKMQMTGYHIANGMLILGLTVLRIVWRVIRPAPPLVATLKAWEVALAKLTHGLFYVLMLAIPLIGWAMVSAFSGGKPVGFFGLFDIPGLPFPADKVMAGSLHEAHEVLAFLMLALLVLHVVAALKHQWVDHDGTMGRMLPWNR